MTTTDTKECSLIGAIAFINTTTYGAGTRGIAWINGHNRHTGYPRLVLNLLAQIVKRPCGMLPSLALLNSCSFPDTLQIFEGNTERVTLSLFNNPFGDGVIDLFRHARFFAAALLEQTAGGLSALALQFTAQFCVTFTQAVEMISRVSLAHRIGGDVFDTQVYPKKFFNVLRFGLFNFAGSKEIELTIHQYQIAFTPLVIEQFKLARASQEGDAQSAINRPDGYFLFGDVPAEDSIIVGDRAVGFEVALGFVVQFVGVCYFTQTANSQLGRKVKLDFQIVVNHLLQPKLIKDPAVPGYITDVIAGGVSLFECFKKGLMLLWGRLQFDFSGQFHRKIVPHYQLVDKFTEEDLRPFLPRHSAGGGMAEEL